MVTTAETIAQQLSKYIIQLQYRDLPEEVIERTREIVLDQLGCQLIGSTLRWNKIIYDFVADFQGRGESTIVNYGTKALTHDAAYVNGTFGQGAELDHSIEGHGGHPSPIAIPVAMALGEKKHVDGKTLLTSIVAGFDITYHLARSSPNMGHRGFHGQSVIGVFNSAAVAGKLLELEATEMTHALAIAGSHASGTMEYDQSGGEVKRLHTGLAVRGGIQSAALAKMGFTGPSTIFEGKRGILPLFAGEYTPEMITEALGQDFGVMHAIVKTYPCVGTLQATIDILVGLIRDYGLKAEAVKRIDVGVQEMTLLHGAAIYEPTDTISAQFSMAFSLAIRLLKGSNDLQLYMDSSLWRDPEVLELARKVHPHADPARQGEKRFGSEVRVTLTSGKILEGRQDYRKGSPQNPLPKEERLDKFQRMASTVLSPERIKEVTRTVDDIENLRDVADLVLLLVR